MKRLSFLVLAVLVGFNVIASTAPSSVKAIPVFNAKAIMIPVGKTGKSISLMNLSTISRTELEMLTGKKMSWFERSAFNKTQKRLKKGIKADGTITDKKMLKSLHKGGDKTTGFHGLGFLLGFVLGLLGVVLAYVINDDDDKQNRVKWAWIGFGIGLLITIGLYILLIAAFASTV